MSDSDYEDFGGGIAFASSLPSRDADPAARDAKRAIARGRQAIAEELQVLERALKALDAEDPAALRLAHRELVMRGATVRRTSRDMVIEAAAAALERSRR